MGRALHGAFVYLSCLQTRDIDWSSFPAGTRNTLRNGQLPE